MTEGGDLRSGELRLGPSCQVDWKDRRQDSCRNRTTGPARERLLRTGREPRGVSQICFESRAGAFRRQKDAPRPGPEIYFLAASDSSSSRAYSSISAGCMVTRVFSISSPVRSM